MKLTRSIVLISLLAFSGAAVAQTPAPAPAAPAAPATPKAAMPKAAMPKTQKPRSAKSMECSKQADSQSLHGKPRHAFMSKCKKS